MRNLNLYKISCQEAKRSQFSKIITLDKKAFGAKLPLLGNELETIESNSVGKIFVVLDSENTILGYCSIIFKEPKRTIMYKKKIGPGEVYIHTIAVDPACQNLKLGAQLAKYVYGWIKKGGFKKISTRVQPENLRAIRIFTKVFNLTINGLLSDCYGKGIDRLTLDNTVPNIGYGEIKKLLVNIRVSNKIGNPMFCYQLPFDNDSLPNQKYRNDLNKILSSGYRCHAVLKKIEIKKNHGVLFFKK